MSHPQLDLSNDVLLTTTRAVRKRLDFDRAIDMQTIEEFMELVVQAPSGSNAQGWQSSQCLNLRIDYPCCLEFYDCGQSTRAGHGVDNASSNA